MKCICFLFAGFFLFHNSLIVHPIPFLGTCMTLGSIMDRNFGENEKAQKVVFSISMHIAFMHVKLIEVIDGCDMLIIDLDVKIMILQNLFDND